MDDQTFFNKLAACENVSDVFALRSEVKKPSQVSKCIAAAEQAGRAAGFERYRITAAAARRVTLAPVPGTEHTVYIASQSHSWGKYAGQKVQFFVNEKSGFEYPKLVLLIKILAI